LYTGIVRRNSVQTAAVHTFKEYRGIVSPDAADLSQDGDHIALVGQNADNTMDVFVWSLNKHAKTSTYTTVCTTKWEVTDVPQPGCVHKLQLSADNLLLMQFAENGSDSEQGLRLWTGASSCVCRMARITATQVTIWMGNPFLSRWEDHLLSPGKATPARADGALT